MVQPASVIAASFVHADVLLAFCLQVNAVAVEPPRLTPSATCLRSPAVSPPEAVALLEGRRRSNAQASSSGSRGGPSAPSHSPRPAAMRTTLPRSKPGAVQATTTLAQLTTTTLTGCDFEELLALDPQEELSMALVTEQRLVELVTADECLSDVSSGEEDQPTEQLPPAEPLLQQASTQTPPMPPTGSPAALAATLLLPSPQQHQQPNKRQRRRQGQGLDAVLDRLELQLASQPSHWRRQQGGGASHHRTHTSTAQPRHPTLTASITSAGGVHRLQELLHSHGAQFTLPDVVAGLTRLSQLLAEQHQQLQQQALQDQQLQGWVSTGHPHSHSHSHRREGGHPLVAAVPAPGAHVFTKEALWVWGALLGKLPFLTPGITPGQAASVLSVQGRLQALLDSSNQAQQAAAVLAARRLERQRHRGHEWGSTSHCSMSTSSSSSSSSSNSSSSQGGVAPADAQPDPAGQQQSAAAAAVAHPGFIPLPPPLSHARRRQALTSLLDHSCAVLTAASAGQLTAMARALSQLKHAPPAGWLRAYYAASQGKLGGYSVSQLLVTIQSLGHWGASPPAAWLDGFYTATRPHLHTLGVPALCILVHGVARMPSPPGPGWLAELLNACEQQFDAFDAPAYALVLHALGRMRHRPPVGWAEEFFDSCGSLLHDFSVEVGRWA